MDSTAHVAELIDQLDDNLDNLQEALKTILSKSLTEVANSYPVLDRAKLYILVTYAIESAIFSFLRLTGTSAREHPVYRELERVKQYFQKAKLAETTGSTIANGTPIGKPAMRLDQAAAGRFIKAALAGNNIAAARSNATNKAVRLDGVADAPLETVNYSKKRKAEEIESESLANTNKDESRQMIVGSSGVDEDSGNESSLGGVEVKLPEAVIESKVPEKKAKQPVVSADAVTANTDDPLAENALRKALAKQKKKADKKRRAKELAKNEGLTDQTRDTATPNTSGPAKKKHKKNKVSENIDETPSMDEASTKKKRKRSKKEKKDKKAKSAP